METWEWIQLVMFLWPNYSENTETVVSGPQKTHRETSQLLVHHFVNNKVVTSVTNVTSSFASQHILLPITFTCNAKTAYFLYILKILWIWWNWHFKFRVYILQKSVRYEGVANGRLMHLQATTERIIFLNWCLSHHANMLMLVMECSLALMWCYLCILLADLCPTCEYSCLLEWINNYKKHTGQQQEHIVEK